MHARIYDFTLGAGGMQRLPVVGDFFKVISATGTINVNVDTGATLDLMPGQGLREFNFNTLTITDKSGAANTGKILVGYSGMIDDRVTGEVSVIDGGKVRAVSGLAFIGMGGCAAGAGVLSHVQLWNPAASGKRVIVEQLSSSFFTQAGFVSFRRWNAELANLYASQPVGKMVSGAPASVAEIRYQQNAAVIPAATDILGGSYGAVNVNHLWRMQEPIVLPPGYGLVTVHQTPNSDLTSVFEFFEEPV